MTANFANLILLAECYSTFVSYTTTTIQCFASPVAAFGVKKRSKCLRYSKPHGTISQVYKRSTQNSTLYTVVLFYYVYPFHIYKYSKILTYTTHKHVI